ncbi:unnamed protein product [Rotaria sordida]|uniref:Uncharacterized protein n=2 Tax=Rotaria sordida TaxID=392033 RepID=A0A815L4X8_9BILA|nr:unnamed protein product [Rotaria sordida]
MQNLIIYNMTILFFCLVFSVSVKISPCAKWNTNGVTIAGSGIAGNFSTQLALPHGIFIDKKTNTLYVADFGNKRIQQFPLNRPSTDGITAVSNVVDPNRIYVDDDDDDTGPTIYIAVFIGNRVEKWTKGATRGVQIGDECRSCSGVSVDREKNVYMSESDRHRVLKWSPRTNTTIIVAGKTDDRGSSSEQLSDPEAIYIDQTSGTLYVADSRNNRVQKWTKDSREGVTVAGSKTDSPGTDDGSLDDPGGVWVDEETNIVYVADTLNNRVVRWLPDSSKGDTIAGGFGSGNAMNQFNTPNDLTFDSEGNLYVCDNWNHRVQMFHIIDNRPCTPTSTDQTEVQTCQGILQYGQCSGNMACGCLPLMNTDNGGICALLQVTCSTLTSCANNNRTCYQPGHLCVKHPKCQNAPLCYPADMTLQVLCPSILPVTTTPSPVVPDDGICTNATWNPNGVTVAGGNGEGSYRLSVFVADYANDRVMKWPVNAKEGIVVAGGNGQGDSVNQLDGMKYSRMMLSPRIATRQFDE